MSEEEFAPYKKLNIIIAKIGKGENEKWGVLNLKGDTILPFEYDNIRFITKEMRYHFIDKSKKPDNVELLLYTEDPKLNNNRIVFLDTNFNTYGYDQENKVIYKK